MELRSTAVPAESEIELRFAEPGAGGQNISPDLRWSGAPTGTLSYLITCFDPDAPTGSGWWHWVISDIAAQHTTLDINGAIPAGARAWPNDFGYRGWGGPWPPPGPAHHYHFRVAALDVERLAVPDDATRAAALLEASFHTIAETSFVALFANPEH